MLVEGFLVIAELVRPVHGPDSQVVGEREFVQMGPIPAGERVIDRDRELSMSGTRVTGCCERAVSEHVTPSNAQ